MLRSYLVSGFPRFRALLLSAHSAPEPAFSAGMNSLVTGRRGERVQREVLASCRETIPAEMIETSPTTPDRATQTIPEPIQKIA